MFSPLSLQLTNSLDKKTKKTHGIFFTPGDIINQSFQAIERYRKDNNLEFKSILEPSCGSCEYIKSLETHYNNVDITGIEYNTEIYQHIKALNWSGKNKIGLIYGDFLKYQSDTKYDLIIGNPPYYVIKKAEVEKKYLQYFDGRPNIFLLFIIHSLNLLAPEGILSFVLPKNFLNCQYYNKLRAHIYTKYTIIDIIDCSQGDYLETNQDTVIMIVQNRVPTDNDKYSIVLPQSDSSVLPQSDSSVLPQSDSSVLPQSDSSVLPQSESSQYIFGHPDGLHNISRLLEGSTSLHKLGFRVNVGKVVWNEVKNLLTDDTDQTLLVYSSDITDNKLAIKAYKNPDKKNYINKPGKTDLLLVVNRGYGKGKYKFSYCLLDTDQPYLVENHLICISSVETDISRENLHEKYQLIVKSLENKKTQQFIELYFSNNAINTSELENILPIYL